MWHFFLRSGMTMNQITCNPINLFAKFVSRRNCLFFFTFFFLFWMELYGSCIKLCSLVLLYGKNWGPPFLGGFFSNIWFSPPPSTPGYRWTFKDLSTTYLKRRKKNLKYATLIWIEYVSFLSTCTGIKKCLEFWKCIT